MNIEQRVIKNEELIRATLRKYNGDHPVDDWVDLGVGIDLHLFADEGGNHRVMAYPFGNGYTDTSTMTDVSRYLCEPMYWICEDCESADLNHPTISRWDKDKQELYLVDDADSKAWCCECGADTTEIQIGGQSCY